MVYCLMSSLKETLDKLYNDFDFEERVKHDPIEFPHSYSDPADIEVVGFIAASFAYGKVGHFKPVIKRILLPGKKHPSRFLKKNSINKLRESFKGISYRFNRERDVLAFLYILSEILKKYHSLKDLFYFHDKGGDDLKSALTGFVNDYFNVDTTPVYGRNLKPQGLLQLLPSPEKGSACKRANLFLRWMVRRRDIDFGIWDKVEPSRLIIPLDTHIAKISRCLGLTGRNASDWRTAREITDSLKKFDPDDPLRYDFALCHQGISGKCKGREYKKICAGCALT